MAHPSTSQTSESPSMTSSGTFLSGFQTQTQRQMFALQRMVQDLRSGQASERNAIESLFQTLNAFKNQMKNIEVKLARLQKVVADQVDANKKLKKEVTDSDNDAKGQIEALKVEFAAVQRSAEDSRRGIEELRRSVGGGSGGPLSIPANITQMIEALERQLSMYDVKLAENDTRFQVLETSNYGGRMIWKIMDFNRRKEDAKRGKTLSIYSQPFYTARYGYKMCLRIYLNGDGMGKNTHVSLFFVLMKGDYDNLLPFPFRQKVTLMLLDQGNERRHLSDVFRPDPTSSSFKKPTTDMNIASGCPMFVSHETLNGSNYLKDDTIFVRVVIDTSDLENY